MSLSQTIDFNERYHCCMLAGAPGSGKSVLARDLLHRAHLQKAFNYCLVLTSTRQNNYWQQIVPAKNVVQINDTQTFQAYIQNLYIICSKARKENKNLKMMLIFEDLQAIKWTTAIIDKLINNHRHLRIHILILSQYLKALKSPNIRSAANIVFVFKQKQTEALKAIYDTVGLCIPTEDQISFNDFKTYLKKNITKKYQTIVFVKLPNEFVGTYIARAPDKTKFKINNNAGNKIIKQITSKDSESSEETSDSSE